ncbi:hypothetical protein WBG78_06165 [Chryseolinea sp. T2]|uniref:hypothetical protein n=1 Tax=Chryseolinea sp. T2 TaxID=3129255 RepID=UPI0030770E70
MKKVMFAFAAMLGSVAFVNAQDASSSAVAPATEQAAPQQEEKTKIKSEELPAPVKKALEMQDYRGWLIDAAYKVNASEQYEVHLKNGAETKIVKFDKDGKVVG